MMMLPVGVQSIVISVSVCLFICLSICLFVCMPVRSHISNTTVQISPNFLYSLPLAVDRSSSDGSAIWYVLRFCG